MGDVTGVGDAGDGFVSSGNAEEDEMRRELQDLQLQMNQTTDEVGARQPLQSLFVLYALGD